MPNPYNCAIFDEASCKCTWDRMVTECSFLRVTSRGPQKQPHYGARGLAEGDDVRIYNALGECRTTVTTRETMATMLLRSHAELSG